MSMTDTIRTAELAASIARDASSRKYTPAEVARDADRIFQTVRAIPPPPAKRPKGSYRPSVDQELQQLLNRYSLEVGWTGGTFVIVSLNGSFHGNPDRSERNIFRIA